MSIGLKSQLEMASHWVNVIRPSLIGCWLIDRSSCERAEGHQENVVGQSQNEVTSEFSLSDSQLNGKKALPCWFTWFVLAIWF